jgi:hypothetical protein
VKMKSLACKGESSVLFLQGLLCHRVLYLLVDVLLLQDVLWEPGAWPFSDLPTVMPREGWDWEAGGQIPVSRSGAAGGRACLNRNARSIVLLTPVMRHTLK